MTARDMKLAKKADITAKVEAYEVKWLCQKGHTNFQVVIGLGMHHDICLKCGAHYDYFLEEPTTE